MSQIDLTDISTRAPKHLSKPDTKEQTLELTKELDELQNKLYAESKWSLLVVLQGMDASGKDGAVKQVFRSVNPQGIRVKSFKAPTNKELAHDFLWRIHQHTPAQGKIQIFNRSHYEDVLVTRVLGLTDDETAHHRFQIINNFEKLLQERGTKIIKFYLHLSQEEQQERFQDRLNNPRKQWKFNPNDLKSASDWPLYRKYYHDVFEHCSPEIPWIIVPADQNWYKEYVIAKNIVETLRGLDMQYPKLME
jgi:PPK2 family polyphosphate:nucleotide phosphotransferase